MPKEDGLVSEPRGIGLVECLWGWKEIKQVLPADFVPATIPLSEWCHIKSPVTGRWPSLKGWEFPGTTLLQCGVERSVILGLLTHLQDEAWKHEYRVCCDTVAFQPNLGGRTDSPGIGRKAMDEKIQQLVERGKLPTLEAWVRDRPEGWLARLLGPYWEE